MKNQSMKTCLFWLGLPITTYCTFKHELHIIPFFALLLSCLSLLSVAESSQKCHRVAQYLNVHMADVVAVWGVYRSYFQLRTANIWFAVNLPFCQDTYAAYRTTPHSPPKIYHTHLYKGRGGKEACGWNVNVPVRSTVVSHWQTHRMEGRRKDWSLNEEENV